MVFKGSVKIAFLGIAFITLGFIQQAVASNETETQTSYENSPYVQVEWRRPEDDQSGHHKCTSRTLDNNREEVTCTTQVKFRQNKLESLWEKVQNMQGKLTLLESKYDYCHRELESFTTEVRDLQDRVDGLQSNLTATTNAVKTQDDALSDLKQKLASATSNLDAVRNTLASVRTEEGTVYCSASNEFKLNTSEGLYNRVKYVRVNFNAPFTKAPQVWGSMRAVDADKNTNFRYNFQIRDITSSGFTLVCQTWYDTVLHGIDYQWRATTPLN